MKHYKCAEGDYIVAVRVSDTTDDGMVEITKSEYDEILSIIPTKPKDTQTTEYKLKLDLTWQECEIEPPHEPEPTAEDALNIILGETP